MRWCCALVAATALTAFTPEATAGERVGDVRIQVFPQLTSDIVATSSGGALLLGEDSSSLFEISAGHVREVAHPDVGPLLSIGDESWILGRDALLHRREGHWQRLELPHLPEVIDSRRASHVVPLGGGRVAVVRVYGAPQDFKTTNGGTKIDFVDAIGTVTELLDLPEFILAHPVADGAGGFWVTVSKRYQPSSDGYAGYAHFANGAWTLWRLPMPKASSYVTELAPMKIVDAAESTVLDGLAPAADGELIGRSLTQLYRIRVNGTISILRNASASDHLCAIEQLVPSAAVHALVSTRDLRYIYLARLDANANVVAPTEIVLPAWYRSGRFRPGVFHCKASASADGRLWISSGPFVLERSASGTLTTYVASSVVEEARETDARERPSIAAATLPPLAVTGIGAATAAKIGDATFGLTAAQTVAGTIAGLPAALFLDVLDSNPCMTGNDSGYQYLNDIACVIRGGGYVVGVSGAGALGALGVYTANEIFDPDGLRGRGYGGAMLGGMLGSVLSIGTTKLMRRYAPTTGRLARSVLAATLIGAASSIGYQVAR
jgi:hypothetical protein